MWEPCPCPNVDECRRSDYNWNFVDSVACICLADATTRFAKCVDRFHKVGLCRHVTFYRPVRDTTPYLLAPTVRGCYESHRAVNMRAMQLNKETCLVFEDDFKFGKHMSPKRLEDFASAMQRLPPQWQIFFLGHWPLAGFIHPLPHPRFHYATSGVFRVLSVLAHAYVAHRPYMERIANTPFDGLEYKTTRDGKRYGQMANDMDFLKMKDVFAFFPMLAFQSNESASSNPKGTISGQFYQNFITTEGAQFAEAGSLFLLPTLVAGALLTVIIVMMCTHSGK